MSFLIRSAADQTVPDRLISAPRSINFCPPEVSMKNQSKAKKIKENNWKIRERQKEIKKINEHQRKAMKNQQKSKKPNEQSIYEQ